MNEYEKIISKSKDEMRDFLLSLCATETAKCPILCNCTFCYNKVSERKCAQKLEEFLNREC